MSTSEPIRVDGLADLRKSLRDLGPDAVKELRLVLRDTAGRVATDARGLAHRRSGRLAASYRPGTSGNTAFVRSTLPYAGVQEFGGVIRPKGAPVRIRPNPAVHRAFDAQMESIVEVLGDAIDVVAARHGFR